MKNARPSKKISVPYLVGEYQNIYMPKPDVYRGPDTEQFRQGQWYDQWLTNDFTMVKGSDQRWHAYGITHPKPKGYEDLFHYGEDVHEAEFQLFHCAFDCSLAKLAIEGGSEHCVEYDKVMYPAERPGRIECWAPCMIRREDLYYLFWSPEQIRYAVTKDMFHFSINDTVLFSGISYLRDPYIMEENGVYTMVYVTDHLCARQSTDLLNWGDEWIMMKNPIGSISAQESPILLRRGEWYYLFWCVYDGQNGAYDERTFVYAACDLHSFEGKAPIAMLKGHAIEVLSEDNQDYAVSVGYPGNGLHITKLCWN